MVPEFPQNVVYLWSNGHKMGGFAQVLDMVLQPQAMGEHSLHITAVGFAENIFFHTVGLQATFKVGD